MIYFTNDVYRDGYRYFINWILRPVIWFLNWKFYQHQTVINDLSFMRFSIRAS